MAVFVGNPGQVIASHRVVTVRLAGGILLFLRRGLLATDIAPVMTKVRAEFGQRKATGALRHPQGGIIGSGGPASVPAESAIQQAQSGAGMTKGKATAIGFSAVLMWSLLALLTIGSAPVPPLLLNALCFGIGGALGLVWTARRGFGVLRGISWKVYAFGTAGLFGYHLLYFTAFRLGPHAATGLIAYLWPLFIVLLSAALPGERLRLPHVLGALIALGGAAMIVLTAETGAGRVSFPALGLAFLCALTWAGYSVLSRRLGSVPTESVTVFCLATAALSALAHLALEPTIWPVGWSGWASVVALGVGPVGLAFFTWDIGMKRGDIQLLGVASYAAPLLSTIALVLAGITLPSWTLLFAAILIAGGAALAAEASASRR